MWMALGMISLVVVIAAFVGTIVGLIIGIVRKRWNVLKWCAVICGVGFALLIVAVAFDTSNDDSESETASLDAPSSVTSAQPATTPVPPSTPTPEPTATPIPTATPLPRVSASELARAYEANEVAAKTKYEEKVALVTGEVRSITDARGKYDVKLLTGDVWTDIVCKVEISEVDSVTALEKGQVVTVLGKIKGKGFVDIVVDPCSIQQ